MLRLSPVEVKYQGRTAKTRLLVTGALRNEVILSRTVLEKLEVIDPDFPNAKTRGKGKGKGSDPKGSDPKGPEKERSRAMTVRMPRNYRVKVAKKVQGSLPEPFSLTGSLPKVTKKVQGTLPEPFPSTGSLPEVTKEVKGWLPTKTKKITKAQTVEV